MSDGILVKDKLQEECGVIGIYQKNAENMADMLYFGLISLQHRGQESAGIAINRGGQISHYKEMGLVQEVFTESIFDSLGTGDIGIGHVRYSTTGQSYRANAQPLVVRYKGGSLALAHNGNLINADKLREELENQGSVFSTTIDTEVIVNLIARHYKLGIEDAILQTVKQIKGAFSFIVTCEDKLIGLRDPHGLRPLCLGQLADGGYVLASESVTLDVVGAKLLRDVEKGEIVIIDKNGINSYFYQEDQPKAVCAFEYVYFARPDSYMDGRSVYASRRDAGKRLFQEQPAEADLVIAVPDSGISAAIGYSQASGIPYGIGLIKNKYLGRTFIQPEQSMRELAVRLKLNVLKENIKGKRLVLVDDSIVRGTTSRKIVDSLKAAGASEVHVRVSSPPVTHSCFFGIDTPEPKDLIASQHSPAEICEMIHADSLGFLSAEGLVETINIGCDKLCKGCFTGDYPMNVPKQSSKFMFE